MLNVHNFFRILSPYSAGATDPTTVEVAEKYQLAVASENADHPPLPLDIKAVTRPFSQ